MNPIMNIAKRALNSKAILIVRKYSPEILTGVGIASGAVTTVFACKATLKIDDILDKHHDTMMTIKKAADLGDESYGSKEIFHDKTVTKLNTAKEIVKLYSPAIGFGTLSVTAILGSYGIMKKRNIAIAAAYSFVNGKFSEYRQNVVNELGEMKDKQFYHGLDSEIVAVKEVGEDGKKHKVEKEIISLSENAMKSPYAKFFDDASPQWANDPDMNYAFLTAQQNYFNDKLKCNGHVFLNEVYDALGIPRTSAGAVVGWILSDDGDNFIDFGVYSIENQEARDFVNGYNPVIFLDFNVDGVIYDLI